MCHSLVMNYGLYKRMEIFVRPVFIAVMHAPPTDSRIHDRELNLRLSGK